MALLLTAINSIECGESAENNQILVCLINSVDAESHIIHNCHTIFSTINQMRKHISRVVVTTNALKCTPYTRNCGKETQEPGMRRIASCWIMPMCCVKTEEELNILKIWLE
jgi:hypothetical protein